MMNSPFVHEMSHALSLLLLQNNVTIEKSIQQLYKRVLIRQAGHNEVQRGKAYVAELMEGGRHLSRRLLRLSRLYSVQQNFGLLSSGIRNVV